jgi:hypothetical protein
MAPYSFPSTQIQAAGATLGCRSAPSFGRISISGCRAGRKCQLRGFHSTRTRYLRPVSGRLFRSGWGGVRPFSDNICRVIWHFKDVTELVLIQVCHTLLKSSIGMLWVC